MGWSRRLLDGLGATPFQTDSGGNTVFLLEGFARAGFIIDTPARERRIRRFVNAFTVSGIVPAALTLTMAPAVWIPVLFLWIASYEVVAHRLVKGLARSTARPRVPRFIPVLAGAGVLLLVVVLVVVWGGRAMGLWGPGAHSIQALASPMPSSAVPSSFPHDDPALEDRIPFSANGQVFKVWSARGERAAHMSNANTVATLAARLGRPISEVTLGVAGRTADSEPGNWVFAYHVDGMSGEAILEVLRASTGLSLERRLIGGREVLTTGSATELLYVRGDAVFLIEARDAVKAAALLDGIDPPLVPYGGKDLGYSIEVSSNWLVVTTDRAADATAANALRAIGSSDMDPIAAVSLMLGTNGVELEGLRVTTEDAPPALRVSVFPGVTEIDIEAIRRTFADAAGSATLPESRRVELPGGSAWETRVTTGTGATATDSVYYHLADANGAVEVVFATTTGRQSAYAESFGRIRDSIRLVP